MRMKDRNTKKEGNCNMLQGVAAIVLYAVLSGIVPVFQKQLVADGLPVFSMMLFNALTMEVSTLVIAALRHHSVKVTRRQFWQAMLMGPCGTFVITAMLNYAYQYITVGTATMIHYFYPTVTCLIMGTVFRQKFSKLQVSAIVISLAGMIFLAGKSGSFSPIGVALALGSAILYGGYLVANEKGPVNDLPLEVKMFYTSLPSLLVVSVLAPATGNLALPSGLISWAMLLACTLIGALLCSFLFLFGIKRLGASTASFLSMICPVVSVVVSTIWFHDPITVGIVVGSILVLLSGVLITMDKARRAQK